ncbi:hypothetical protein ABEB36_005536 [Hypothenemus hampei]|uniref:RRM domain-containing protein n=1 Tax=Hypothenemus hampei TaxID=57062 RepID=A0ABD1EYK0_HYPHA
MDDARTLWVGNLSEQVTEELLYELFLQAGPLERVKIPTDREGKKSSFGFVTFLHEVSVPYTLQLFQEVKLFDRPLKIQPRNGGSQKDNQTSTVQQSMPRDFQESLKYHQNEPRFLQDFNPEQMNIEEWIHEGQIDPLQLQYSQGYDYDNEEHTRTRYPENRRNRFKDRHNRDQRGRHSYNYDLDRNRRNEYRNKWRHKGNGNKKGQNWKNQKFY